MVYASFALGALNERLKREVKQMSNLLREAKPSKRSQFGLAVLSTTIKAATVAMFGCALAVAAGTSADADTMTLTAPDTMMLTARSYSMPAGDHGVTNYGPVSQVARPPRRIPIGNAALSALKAKAASYPAQLATTLSEVKSAAPSPKGLVGTCTLNSAVGFAPSDVHGAASPSRLVETTNIEVGVYNIAGCGLVSKVPLKTFFGVTNANETDFDPQTLYIRRYGRWFVTAESENSVNHDQFQYFAVSTDSNATAWRVYTIPLSSGASKFCKQAVTSFWDYPHAGESYNRISITANDFGASVTGAILSIDEIPTFSGGSVAVKCFAGLPFNLAAPIVLDTSATSNFLSPGSGSGNTITSRVVTATGTASGSAGADTIAVGPSYAITAWTAPPNAPQPNGTTLDSLDGRFQSNSLQSRGFIWNIHTQNNGGRAAIKWFELLTGSSTVVKSAIFQTSSVDHLFNASITTGSGLQGAPGFINTSRTIPSIPTTGNAAMIEMYGLNNDTTAPNWTFSVAGTSTFQFTGCSACRWGDYSSITVDPTNSGSAWGFNQLVTGTSQFNWTTKAGKVNLNLLSAPVSN